MRRSPSSVVTVAMALAVLIAAPARAQDAPAAPAAPETGTATTPEQDRALLGRLRDLEARLSQGQDLSAAELDVVTAAAKRSADASVRALAVAVLAWLDPGRALEALLVASGDTEARVRAGAAQSLLSLGRRLDDEQRRRVVSAGLMLLDDPADEVACASAELVGALAPSAAVDALRARAAAAGDVRYACYSRIAGLPLRAVDMPALPELTPPAPPAPDGSGPTEPALPPPVAPPPAPPDGTALFVGTGAAAGLVAGGLLPSGLVPSRDVLTYTPGASRITREEVAFPSQAAAAVVGAAALGGGAWALSTWVRPLHLDEATAVALGTGSLGLVGGAAQLTFGLREGPAAYAMAAGLGLGFVASTGVVYGFELDVDDQIMAASALALGGLTSGLVTFAAVPVGVTDIGDAKRVDFGLGLIGMGAGVASFTALAVGGFVDVPRARTFAVLTGGVLAGGAATAVAFLVVPQSDVKSRIACGIGVGGELVGMVAGLLVPDAWLPGAPSAVGSAVNIDDGKVAMGVPILEAWAAPAGTQASAPVLGATLVRARF